jgi:alanyl-tRNA synthetase
LEKGIDAGKVVKEISPLIGGGGGGRKNFAQGGGTQTERIGEAIQRVEEIVKRQICC